MKNLGFQKIYRWNTALPGGTSTSYTTTITSNYTASRSTQYSASTTRSTSIQTSRSTSRSTNYATSRSTGYSESYNTTRSTSRTTSYGTTFSVTYTTSWTSTVSTSYNTSVTTSLSIGTFYQTSRFTDGGDPGGGPGGFVCVEEGTLISVNTTQSTLVENLSVGDAVLTKQGGFNTDDETAMHLFSADTLTGDYDTGTITAKQRFTVNKMIEVNGGLLRATPDHRMIVKQEDAAGDLKWLVRPLYFCAVGDHFLDVNNNEVEITSKTEETGTFYVWQMDIEDQDVYYAGGLLNHNYYY